MSTYPYAYAIVNKSDGECLQTIRTTNGDWRLDNANHFSVEIPSAHSSEFLNKFYHDGKWWERIYNRYEIIVEKDEEGNMLSEFQTPVIEDGYVETEWSVY